MAGRVMKPGLPILVTGASGQIGSAFCQLGPDRGADVLALGRKDLDVTDRAAVEALVADTRPGVVVNCAAFTDVDAAEDDPETAAAVNAAGPEHLARACHGAGTPLIHISTDYVFDGKTDRPYREDDAPHPINTYGRTKLEGERAVRNVLRRHLIIRTSWVFAPGHRNFVTTILRIAREREEVRVVSDQRGSPTPAGALAAQLVGLAARVAAGEELAWGTHHLAGEPPASRYELAEAVVEAAREAGHEIACRRIIPVDSSAFPTPARRPASTALDCTRAREALGVERIGWRDALDEITGG